MSDDVRRLRSVLAGLRQGHGRRYEATVRAEIGRVAGQLRKDGATWNAVGKALGLPLETARRFWMDGGERGREGFVPVEVERITDVRRPVLITRSGHRVEGLDLESLTTLLARLS